MTEIKTIPIADLKPAPYNPRKDLKPGDAEYDKIKASITAFGFLEPLVWNSRTGYVVGGHQRLKVLAEQGVKAVPCVVVDFDEDTERAANLALNKIEGAWDFSKLADVLLELEHANFDLDLTGFDAGEVKNIMAWVPGAEEATDDDFDAEAALAAMGEPTAKRGDIWQLGRHRVMCGDSTSAEDVAKLMDGASPGVVWADPPYGISIVDTTGWVGGSAAYDIPFGGRKVSGSDGAAKPFGSKAKRGTDGASHIVKVGIYDEVVGDDSTDTAVRSYRFTSEAFPKATLIYWGGNHYASQLPDSPCWLVWDKQNTGNFADVEIAWTSHKGAARLFTHQWNGMLKASERGEKRVHPTQKPVALAGWAFALFDGDILDPFLGSGMGLIAAEQLGRVCFGMEIEPRYVDVTIQRWEKLTGQTAELTDNGKSGQTT